MGGWDKDRQREIQGGGQPRRAEMCLENIVTSGSNYLRLTQPFTFPFSSVSGNASRNVLQDTVSDTEHTEEVDMLGILL